MIPHVVPHRVRISLAADLILIGVQREQLSDRAVGAQHVSVLAEQSPQVHALEHFDERPTGLHRAQVPVLGRQLRVPRQNLAVAHLVCVHRLTQQPLGERDRLPAQGAVRQKVRHPHVRQHRKAGRAAAPALDLHAVDLQVRGVGELAQLAQHRGRDFVLGVERLDGAVDAARAEHLVQRDHLGNGVLHLGRRSQLRARTLGVVQLLPLAEHVHARQQVEQPLRPVHGRASVQLGRVGGDFRRYGGNGALAELDRVRYGGRGRRSLEPLKLPLEERVQLEVQVAGLLDALLLHVVGVVPRQRGEVIPDGVGVAGLHLLDEPVRSVRRERHDRAGVHLHAVVHLLRVALQRAAGFGVRLRGQGDLLRREVALQHVHFLVLHRAQQVCTSPDPQEQIIVHHDPRTLIQPVTVEVGVQRVQHVVADLQRLVHPGLRLLEPGLRQQPGEAARVVRRIAVHHQRQRPSGVVVHGRSRRIAAPMLPPSFGVARPSIQRRGVLRRRVACLGSQRGDPTLELRLQHRRRPHLVAHLQRQVQRVHDRALSRVSLAVEVEQIPGAIG